MAILFANNNVDEHREYHRIADPIYKCAHTHNIYNKTTTHHKINIHSINHLYIATNKILFYNVRGLNIFECLCALFESERDWQVLFV